MVHQTLALTTFMHHPKPKHKIFLAVVKRS